MLKDKQPIDMFSDIKPLEMSKVGVFNNQKFVVTVKINKHDVVTEDYTDILIRCNNFTHNPIFTMFHEYYLPTNTEEFPEALLEREIYRLPNERIHSIINVGRDMEVKYILPAKTPEKGRIHQLN